MTPLWDAIEGVPQDLFLLACAALLVGVAIIERMAVER